MRLYIMRHGETEWNVRRLYQGHSDIPLNENGVALAEITGRGLRDIPFDLAFTSPLRRARPDRRRSSSGAGTSSGRGAKLIEIAFGVYEGCTALPQSGTLIRTPISSTSSGTRSTTWPPRAASPSPVCVCG